jgi:methylated-DNA-protein-cysteine methyltransferase related protein
VRSKDRMREPRFQPARFPAPGSSAISVGVRGMRASTQGRWERVYTVVRRIPAGHVATYGQIAQLAGLGCNARQVGYALHVLPNRSLVPWHRVINARGEISLGPLAGSDVTQRLRLEREGVHFDAGGRTDLSLFGWKPSGGRRKAVRLGSRTLTP